MNNKLWQSLANSWKIPELRKKLLFTAGMLAIYRFGAHVPVPGVDVNALKNFFNSGAGGVLGFLDLFSGGALGKVAVFALGIMPYITASIIMQLLTVVMPKLEELQKEGEQGQKIITQYSRYLTVGAGRGTVDRLHLPVSPIPRAAQPRPRPRRAHPVHADGGRDGGHVARRAHHRARHRQRHVDPDLHQHRLAAAWRHLQVREHGARSSDRFRRHRPRRDRRRHLDHDR